MLMKIKENIVSDRELSLYTALKILVCCPAFNGTLFDKDRESLKAWTLARWEIEDFERMVKKIEDNNNKINNLNKD